MTDRKKIVFISGTRAEYGKIKPLLNAINMNHRHEAHLFVTGMHMLEKYGSTAHEVLKEFRNVYMYNNQAFGNRMEIVLSNTVYGFSHYVSEIRPDLIVIHGDRVEALAGAVVGSFNNIRVAHIEGGEVSGTIDELIRHSVSKLAHVHFVANDQAKRRLIQMGEVEGNIYVIGSPDIDIMFSEDLPDLDGVLKHYEIPFREFAILLYHSITTELSTQSRRTRAVVDAVIESGLNYIVVYPNNDTGSDAIFREYERLENRPDFRLFPSIKFESFLVLMKNCRFIIGNSSAGIREAPTYSVPTINLGSRQRNRFQHDSIHNAAEEKDAIAAAIQRVLSNSDKVPPSRFFGDGSSVRKFMDVLHKGRIWEVNTQKHFIDL